MSESSHMAPERVVVTPVFEDVEAASRLFLELRAALGEQLYLVAIDDGSVRQPLPASAIADAGLHGVVLRLRRNVGHQHAIAIGLGYVADQLPAVERVVVMDCDGEDLPSSIAVLLHELDRGDIDIAVAARRSRVETLRFRAFYQVYKAVFGLLTGRRINFGNFMAINRTGLQRLASMGEVGTHLAGSVLLSRLRWRACALDRGPRYAGQSKMNFVGLALHGFKGLMVFAEDVLVRVGAACALVAAVSLVASLAAILLKSIGFATPGWFSVALGILLLIFLQTGAITLMSLMLTGVMRSAAMLPMDYSLLLAETLPARPGPG